MVSTKVGDDPWSWERKVSKWEYAKLGDILDVEDQKKKVYQAYLVHIRSTSWRFHFIGRSKTADEYIPENELENRVFERGSRTKGFYWNRKKSPFSYLYPPYPRKVIPEIENIKLWTYFEIITTLSAEKPKLARLYDTNENDLLDCLAKDEYCRDITFELKGGVTIKAHKSVLAVRSPVLRKMFTTNMVERKTGILKLLDVHPEAMRIFVDILYDIKLPDSLEPDVWEAVFWLCDKYKVDFIIPDLFSKVSNMLPNDIFPRLFDIFRKVPRLESYFIKHKRAFINGVLKIPPKSRTKAMQDFLLGTYFS